MNHAGRQPAIPALAIGGLCINLLLLARSWDASAIAGCGGGPCDELLASRWSSLLGIPVTAFGALAYVALLLSFIPRLVALRLPLLGMISGAACWFILVQALILRKFCPWCMAAHLIALLMVLLAGMRDRRRYGTIVVWAAAAFLGIGLCQVFGPQPATHRIEGEATPAAARSIMDAGKRSVVFDGGRLSFDVAATPRLGPAGAEHVMVEYFDYQCAACRVMAWHIEALVANHPGRIAVLLMPVPLDADCNHALGKNTPHPGSCGIARIALAVWRTRPDAFAAFHKSLVAAPSEASARSLALALMTEHELAAALTDPWLGEVIRSNIATWRDLSKSTDKLPKLLIRDRRILHGLPSNQADFLRVMARELGLAEND